MHLYKKVVKQSQSSGTCTQVGSDAAMGSAMFVFAAGRKGARHGHGKEGHVLSANLSVTVLAEAPVQSSSCVGGSSRFSLQDPLKVHPELPGSGGFWSKHGQGKTMLVFFRDCCVLFQ